MHFLQLFSPVDKNRVSGHYLSPRLNYGAMAFFLILLAIPALAQFSDSFADGNFNAQPTWSGDDTSFIVALEQLHLRGPSTAKQAYLSTASQSIDEASWAFSLTFDFNPSSNNYARVYLVSDQPNLSADLNGYFVLIGGAADEISLYRQAGATETKIIDGPDGRVDQSPLNATINVTRDKEGNWQLFSDVGNTNTVELEGRAVDRTFVSSSYFGISCHYTATRSDKFHFDNFVVAGMAYKDTTAPFVRSIQVISSTTINVIFDEPLNATSAGTATNYMVSDEVGVPATAQLLPDLTTVMLTFTNTFKNGVRHTLTLAKIMDLKGNAIVSASFPFMYLSTVPATHKDIIITEIYANPTPQAGLPNAEFVELYNRTKNPFELTGWTLSDGNTTATLAEEIILPGHYRVVTSAAKAAVFMPALEPIGVSSFPALNNDEDRLILKNPLGQTIDSLHYTSHWYRHTAKQEGGWSLALIDPDNICGEEGNWTASENEKGGTPGAPNTVLASKPDLIGPKLISVVALAADHILLTFDEKLESPLRNTVSFTFDPPLVVSRYKLESPSLRTLSLRLNTPLQRKQAYVLTVEEVFDCSGNAVQHNFNKHDVGLPEQAGPSDLLINEVLFNPRLGGVDFVEVYNNTATYIAMKGWSVANFDNEQVINANVITRKNFIIRPHTYCVFTPDPTILQDHYPQGERTAFVSLDLPPLPDREGTVVLTRADGMVVDQLRYTENFHSPFLSDNEGVSVERISFLEATNNKENWRSASSTAGFATPGFVNSNFRPQGQTIAAHIHVDPPLFIPYFGLNDFAKISFRFERAGLVATVKIVDHRGRAIKSLANNELLGVEGFFRWEGDQDNGRRARAGYYYVSFDVFAADGRVDTFRNRIIIATP